MTDPATSGGPDAPSAENPAPVPPAGAAGAPFAAAAAPTPGAFGSTRGSGLLRGKRPTAQAAASASPKPGDYQPTAVEVITAQREYKNPFGGAVSTPPTASSEEEVDTAPPAVPQEPRQPEKVARPEVSIAASAPPAEPAARAEPAPRPETGAADAKSQLNILPPAEMKRTQLHWDKSHSADKDRAPEFAPRPRRDERRDERPSFRSEGQRPRDDSRPRQPFVAPVEKPLGFIGRLKRWLGLGKPAPAAGAVPGRDFESDRGERDQGFRRRRRGGRGHHGGDRNEQGGMPQSQGGGGGQSFERRGVDQGGGGQNRRRHRGGRGRNRGGPRPEGQQGGGYI